MKIFNRFATKTVTYNWESHRVRKVQQSETLGLSGGYNCWLKRRRTKKKRPVTRNNKNSNTNNNIHYTASYA